MTELPADALTPAECAELAAAWNGGLERRAAVHDVRLPHHLRAGCTGICSLGKPRTFEELQSALVLPR